jgi:hypothetical protein
MKFSLATVSLALCSFAFADDEPSAFMQQTTQHFSAWDADHDNALTILELDRAIANDSVKGEAAAAVVALKRGTKDKAAKLTLDAIKARKDYPPLFTWAQTRITKADRTLFATPQPKIDSIKQGKLGDCFCLAALRTVIQRDPQAVTQMINAKADGSYEVKVGSKTIAVRSLTDGEIAMGASTNDGLWPLVYEKAVGISRLKPDANDATPFNVVTKGGSAGSMMSTLTGNEIKRWSCKTWRDEKDEAKKSSLLDDVRQQLTSAFAEKRLVTGGTAGRAADKKGPPGILFNHGYAVLGYDAAKDEVHLWNPHGDAFKPKGEPGLTNGYPMEKGEFRVPLKELVTFFGGFAFEQVN